jgi:hypothetical protein
VNILFDSRSYSSATIDAQLAALRSSGATVARSDALWELIEPVAPVGGVHHYVWGFDDSTAGALALRGLQWLPIVDYTAPWTRSSPVGSHPPPASTSDYAAFAAALASRYGPGGSFWRFHPAIPANPVHTYEIWNEPDNPTFWSPAPDAVRYADLYLRARDAITAVDPSARVLIGGLTNPVAFLPALIDSRPDLRGHVDGVAIHPYAPRPEGLLTQVRAARDVLRAEGLGDVPLYVTEFGWTTRPAHALDWAPADQRPGYIASTLTALGHSNCGIAAVVLYTWMTLERNPANREDWYGIHPPEGGSSADVAAFAAGIRAAAAPAARESPLC